MTDSNQNNQKDTQQKTQGGWLRLIWLFLTAPLRWIFGRKSTELPAPPQQPELVDDSEALEPQADSPTETVEIVEPPSDAIDDAEVIVEPPATVEPPPPVAEIEAEAPPAELEKVSFFQRIRSGLQRGNSWFSADLRALFSAGELDEDILEDLETQLLMADVGVEATEQLIEQLQLRFKDQKSITAEQAVEGLRIELRALIEPCNEPLEISADRREQHGGPFVILVVGVNGVGKTTTIGKLAHHYRQQGLNVMLAAGDTFRAAAVEQLKVWGERNDIPVVAQDTGADSAAVIFDALASARAKNVDLLIADTAGRLHTNDGLMDELSKIKRVMAKLDDSAPHEVLLVVDGGTGQNALSQLKLFNQAVGLTGLAVTKLDGTAKGGMLFALAKTQPLPIRFIGVGEAIEDLGVFNADEFISALFPDEAGAEGADSSSAAA